jgi:hypothetical protein
MKPSVERLEVSTEELEALLEGVREPLGEDGYQKLKAAIRTLGYVTELLENREANLATLRRLLCLASTEKTAQVLKQAGLEVGQKNPKPAVQSPSENATPGHGRHEAAAYRGAHKIKVPHGSLHQGDRVRSVSGAKSIRFAIPACSSGSKDRRQSRPRCTS